MQREQLSSRAGFILLSAGCAIGIGNVWKFPYIAGQYGGGAFVLIYLICLLAVGVPVMTIEFAMGRASRRSPAKMYYALEPAGSRWHIHGYIAVAGSYLLMMFYTTVCGWMINYFISTAAGLFDTLDANKITAAFTEMQSNAAENIIFMGISVLTGAVICSFSLKNGVERITKIMMTALLLIMIVLAINSVATDKSFQGLRFYLIPDIKKIKEAGILNIITAAMNQAFFTLSLGMGAMSIFGSYINKSRSLAGEAVTIALLDTFVAVTSGLIIFPACFSYGIDVNSGQGLIFITLPNVFNHLPYGRLWGSLFFLFMTFAALSTVITVFECIIASFTELTGICKKKACIINGIALFILSLPCTLGTNLLSDIQPFGEGSSIMDLEDFLVTNIILPVGAICFILFCTSKKGWGWHNFIQEANTGKGLKISNRLYSYVRFILPAVIIVLFFTGILARLR